MTGVRLQDLTWVLLLTRLGSSVKDPPRQITVSFPFLHMQEQNRGQDGAEGAAADNNNNNTNNPEGIILHIEAREYKALSEARKMYD